MSAAIPAGPALNVAAQPLPAPGRDALAWALFAALLLFQYGIFREFVLRELTPIYPRMFDQAAYLYSTYGLHEAILEDGLASAGQRAWQQRSPQSLLFQAEAALLMLVSGASRLGALSFGFLHFALLQAGLVATLRRLSGGWTAPGLALGLLLSARTAFGWGGLGDFRTDLPALCLGGLFLCAVLSSNSLAGRRAGLYVGAAAVYLALFRYITTIYLLGTLLAFGAFLLVAYRWTSPADQPSRSARRRGLGLALGVLLLFAFLYDGRRTGISRPPGPPGSFKLKGWSSIMTEPFARMASRKCRKPFQIRDMHCRNVFCIKAFTWKVYAYQGLSRLLI